MTAEERSSQATVKKRVKMSGTVIRKDGSKEDIEFLGGSAERVVELTEEELAALIGAEEAAKVFKGTGDADGE